MHFTRRTPIDSLRPGPRALALAALAAAGVASAVALTGCNIVTPVAYAIEGPGQIEAEHTLANRKTVVFVDDPTNKLPRTALRTALGDAISLDLMGREILGSTVATRDAVVASRQLGEGDAGKLASIEKIGRALDCAQVIYVRPIVFDLAGRSDMQGIRPTAIVRVKVLDLDSKERVYPSPDVMPSGREVTVTIRETSSEALRSRAGRVQIEDALVQRIAVDVARLFYKHDRIDLGENLGTRRQ